MAKQINVGVGGVVKKVKEVPFSIGGVIKKAKKGVCGVGGVVKTFFGTAYTTDYGYNTGASDNVTVYDSFVGVDGETIRIYADYKGIGSSNSNGRTHWFDVMNNMDTLGGKSFKCDYSITNYSAFSGTVQIRQYDADGNELVDKELSGSGSYSVTLNSNTTRIRFRLWMGGQSSRRTETVVFSNITIAGKSLFDNI